MPQANHTRSGAPFHNAWTATALSPAVAGRVRGYFRGQAKLLRPAKSSQCCYTLPVRIPTQRVRELRRNQTEAEKPHRLCCPVESWTRNLAVHAGSRAGLPISTASNLEWRSSLMAVFILSRAKCPKTLRKRIVMLADLIPPRRATDPSPVPLRLVKAPAAGHPLPKGEKL